MKGTAIKKFPIFTLICLLMAAIFVALELIPAVSAWSTLTGGNKEQTKYITEFESVNPVEYYELENGGSYKDLDIPQKVRAVVELPQDIQLSTFKEEQAPEQQDELLPKYEYSHTVDKLMLEAQEDTSSADITSSAEETSSIEETSSSLVEEETSSQSAETESFQADDTSSEESSMTTVTEEETQELLDESSKTSYNSAKVYSFVDSTGKTQYRVYGSIDGGEAQWYAVDKEGIMLGAVEELDANWDFSKLDSTVAGTYQVKVQLPENYVLNQGVEIAYMQIMVAQENSEQISKEQGSTLTSGTYKKIITTANALAWNAKDSPLEHMYNSNATNEGDNFVLTATFKYDVTSKDIIQQYWDESQDLTNPVETTDDGMGYYLNWAMYGYNPRTGESSTWVIREKM